MSERTNAPTCDRCGETMSLTLRHPDDPDDAPDIYICPNVMCGFSHYPPAAVSAPAGEATPDEGQDDQGLGMSCPECEAPMESLSADEDYCGACETRVLRGAALRGRSPAPASGAPGEEGPLPCALGADPDAENDPELSDEAFAKWRAAEDEQAAFSRLHALTMGQKGGRPDYGAFVDGASAQTVLNYVARLEARLAAAERAGVALREALTFYATQANWFSPSEGFALQYDPEPSPVARDSGAKARAALTPTSPAPSPEEER